MIVKIDSKYVTQFLESIIKNQECGNIRVLRAKFIYSFAS